MPTIWPTLLLIVTGGVTLTVLATTMLELRRRRAGLRALADEAGCAYQPQADSALLEAILPRLRAPGAADLRLIDLISCRRDGGRLFIGRVDYALGAIRQRRDNTRILAVRIDEGGRVDDVMFAPQELARIDQYRHLLASAGFIAESPR